MNSNLVNLLTDLGFPQEAIQAALNRQSWKFAPTTIDEMIYDCEFCEECETFHPFWIGFGFSIDKSETICLRVNSWSCDFDGDWENTDSTSVQTIEEFQKATYVDWDVILKHWDEYYQYVVESGQDPLDIFPSHKVEEQNWTVFLKNSAAGIKLVSAQKISPEKTTVIKNLNLPKELLEFCQTDQHYIVDSSLGTTVAELLPKLQLETIKTGVLDINTEALQDGGIAIQICISVPRDPTVIRQELIRSATEAVQAKNY